MKNQTNKQTKKTQKYEEKKRISSKQFAHKLFMQKVNKLSRWAGAERKREIDYYSAASTAIHLCLF